jgi:hypothetical protein
MSTSEPGNLAAVPRPEIRTIAALEALWTDAETGQPLDTPDLAVRLDDGALVPVPLPVEDGHAVRRLDEEALAALCVLAGATPGAVVYAPGVLEQLPAGAEQTLATLGPLPLRDGGEGGLRPDWPVWEEAVLSHCRAVESVFRARPVQHAATVTRYAHELGLVSEAFVAELLELDEDAALAGFEAGLQRPAQRRSAGVAPAEPHPLAPASASTRAWLSVSAVATDRSGELGWAAPYLGPDGALPFWIRRVATGRPKYRQPKDSGMVPYFGPRAMQVGLHDPAVPLVIVEGVKKWAAVMDTLPGELACVSWQGIYTHDAARRAETGEWTLPPEVAELPLAGRKVYVIHDSDLRTNPWVALGHVRTCALFEDAGADVRRVQLGQRGKAKDGVDDLLWALPLEQRAGALRELLAGAEGWPVLAPFRSAPPVEGQPAGKDALRAYAARMDVAAALYALDECERGSVMAAAPHGTKGALADGVKRLKKAFAKAAAEQHAAEAEAEGRIVWAQQDGTHPHEVAVQLFEAAKKEDPPPFERGGKLAVMRDGRVCDLDRSEVTTWVAERVQFFRWNGNENATAVAAELPSSFITLVTGMVPTAGLRSAADVLPGPVLTDAGVVLSGPATVGGRDVLVQHGFDARVRMNPSQDDARAALAKVRELVGEFRWQSPGDEAAWLGLLIQAVTRHTHRRPLLVGLISAEEPDDAPAWMTAKGAGKTALARVIAKVGGPDSGPMRTLPPTTERRGWEVQNAVRSNPHGVTVFDNVAEGATIASSELEVLVTNRDGVRFRLVGSSTEVNIEAHSHAFVFTSNGARMSEDMLERTLLVRIHPQPEQGWQPRFSIDDVVEERRAELWAAVATMYRAWHLAGRPAGYVAPGAIHERFRVVRDIMAGVLSYAGLEDVLGANMAEAKEAARFGSDIDPLLLQLVKNAAVAGHPVSMTDFVRGYEMSVTRMGARISEQDLGRAKRLLPALLRDDGWTSHQKRWARGEPKQRKWVPPARSLEDGPHMPFGTPPPADA